METNSKFKDKTVLVTGSSRGIGKAIALGFAEEGANVVLCCKINMDLLKVVANTVRDYGREVLALKMDVTNLEEVDQAVGLALDKFDNIDILINNAGNFNNALTFKMDNKVWSDVINVNLNGVFNCTQAVLGAGIHRIINITSVQALTGAAGASNYAAAKAGVIGFTKSVALELSKRSVTVNAIAVGFVDIGMLRQLSKELQKEILSRIPMGRFGKPEEVASLAMFLASEEASYITGQVIGINGGYYI